MKRILFAFGVLLAACGTPGVEVVSQPGDFALVWVKLRG